MQKIFIDARTTLEKNLSNEFAEKCHAYAINTLTYNKNPAVNLDASSIVEESFMMVSDACLNFLCSHFCQDLSILQTGGDLMATHEDLARYSSTAIPWNLTECQRDEQVELLFSKRDLISLTA